jgi:hypothetical protein
MAARVPGVTGERFSWCPLGGLVQVPGPGLGLWGGSSVGCISVGCISFGLGIQLAAEQDREAASANVRSETACSKA